MNTSNEHRIAFASYINEKVGKLLDNYAYVMKKNGNTTLIYEVYREKFVVAIAECGGEFVHLYNDPDCLTVEFKVDGVLYRTVRNYKNKFGPYVLIKPGSEA